MGAGQLSVRWMCRRRGVCGGRCCQLAALPRPAGARFAVEKQLGAAWRPASHRLPPPPLLRQSVYPAVSPRTGDLGRMLMELRAWWPVAVAQVPCAGRGRGRDSWQHGRTEPKLPTSPKSAAWVPGTRGWEVWRRTLGLFPVCLAPKPWLGGLLGDEGCGRSRLPARSLLPLGVLQPLLGVALAPRMIRTMEGTRG